MTRLTFQSIERVNGRPSRGLVWAVCFSCFAWGFAGCVAWWVLG